MAEGDPIGADLASSTRSLNLGITETIYTFTLDDTYPVVSATKYAVVLKATGATVDDAVKWIIDTGITAYGKLHVSADSGASWATYGEGISSDAYMQTKAGGVVKDDLSFGSEATGTGAYGTKWLAQTFTATSSYLLDQIVVKIRDENPFVNPGQPVTVVVSLKATEAAAGVPTKATNPSPADDATEEDFSGLQLSWDDGGDSDTYDVYIGETGSLTLVSVEQVGTTYTTTLSELETIFGVSPIDQKIYWRIDSTNAEGTTVGDEWNFDARPGKATGPTPANAGTAIALNTAFDWTLGTNGATNELFIDATSYLNSADVTYTMTSDLFGWSDDVAWSVSTTNDFGTTTGTAWAFTALDLDPVISTWTTIADTGETGWTGEGPLAGGVEGLDFRWTGLNNVTTLKRLIVITKDRVFYEDL